MARMNSHKIGFEDAARVSTFLGIVRLLELRAKYPEAQDHELINAATAGSASQIAGDVITAAKLIDILELDQLKDDAVSMRLFLDRLLAWDQPSWMIAAVRGRSSLQSIMPPAPAQCFSMAQLFESTPDTDTLQWWDRLAQSQRGDENQKLKDNGRRGERLTLEHESKRLQALGISEEPRWVSIDDEWLGYDVLSYDLTPGGTLKNRLIEVKACSGLPLRIFLTKNEWQQALNAKEAYKFHVWYLPTEQLHELNWDHLCDHIPEERGSGVWQEISILLNMRL